MKINGVQQFQLELIQLLLALEVGRLKRQWLHAVRLGFEHPGSGEWICVESEYPEDLKLALVRLQEGA